MRNPALQRMLFFPRTAVLLAFLLATGCGGGTESQDILIRDETAVETARQWLEGVATGEPASVADLVEPTGLAVLAAIESNLRSDELAGLLTSGFSDDLATQYWADFGANFLAFSGTGLQDVTIGQESPVPGAADFTSVTLSTDDANGYVILRKADSGWQIDFSATIGPALVGPLGDYLASALEGDHAETIAAAYREAVVPGLDAAIALDPENTRLSFEAEFLRQLSGA